jgi:hypothetical protein
MRTSVLKPACCTAAEAACSRNTCTAPAKSARSHACATRRQASAVDAMRLGLAAAARRRGCAAAAAAAARRLRPRLRLRSGCEAAASAAAALRQRGLGQRHDRYSLAATRGRQQHHCSSALQYARSAPDTSAAACVTAWSAARPRFARGLATRRARSTRTSPAQHAQQQAPPAGARQQATAARRNGRREERRARCCVSARPLLLLLLHSAGRVCLRAHVLCSHACCARHPLLARPRAASAAPRMPHARATAPLFA